MNKRLAGAMLAYGVLAAIAFRLLEGKILYAVLIFFAGLAAKTLIAAKRDEHERKLELPEIPSSGFEESSPE